MTPPPALTTPRHRRPARRRRAATGLAGVLVVGAGVTAGWPLLTNLYQSRLQHRLAARLSQPSAARAFRSDAVPVGDSLTRLRIPALGVDVVVVEGTTDDVLRAGAGHYPGTPLPCQAGNVAIAGHRTTYGRPFADLDRLRPGDRVVFDTPLGTCAYTVDRSPFSVPPDATWVVAPDPGSSTLTLTTCTPRGSASHRLIVKAHLSTPAPRGADVGRHDPPRTPSSLVSSP